MNCQPDCRHFAPSLLPAAATQTLSANTSGQKNAARIKRGAGHKKVYGEKRRVNLDFDAFSAAKKRRLLHLERGGRRKKNLRLTVPAGSRNERRGGGGTNSHASIIISAKPPCMAPKPGQITLMRSGQAAGREAEHEGKQEEGRKLPLLA